MNEPMHHRNLGWFESYLVDMNAIVVAVVEIDWNQRFDKYKLNDALHKCIMRHHHLRLGIRKIVKPYEFYFLSQLLFAPVYMDIDSEDQWKTIADEEVHTSFDLESQTEGLFKVLILASKNPVITKQFMLIKYHHAIADGTSGMIILNTILSYYFEPDVILPALPCLPDTESLSFPHVSSEDDRKTYDLINHILEYKRQWTPTIPYGVAPNTRNTIKFYHGTAENMSKLLQRCRQEQVTIGSALLAATYFSIAELVKDTWCHNENSRFDNFQFDIDVNLRHRYSNPLSRYEHVGLHIAMMNIENIGISLETKFWELCRVIHTKVQEDLSKNQHLLQFRAIRLCSDDNEVEKQTSQYHGRINDLNLSNIGSYPFQNVFGDLRLKHYYCVGSDACPSIATNVILVSSVECLDYILLHESGEENETIAKQWFERMIQLVDTAWTYDEKWSFKAFINQ